MTVSFLDKRAYCESYCEGYLVTFIKVLLRGQSVSVYLFLCHFCSMSWPIGKQMIVSVWLGNASNSRAERLVYALLDDQ